ncbi:MAG: hypothetical protein ACRD1O_09870, partial [Terriglobia bacterium]
MRITETAPKAGPFRRRRGSAGAQSSLQVPATLPSPFVTRPQVYLIGRQSIVEEELSRFLEDEGLA